MTLSHFAKLSVCAFAVVTVTGVAQAAVVEFTLITHGGPLDTEGHTGDTWELYATASPGDNAGIAAFNIDLIGLGPGGTAIANAPEAYDLDVFEPRGFTVGNGDSAGNQVAVFAGQLGGGPNLRDVASVIFGVGQEPGSIDFFPGTETGIPWDFPVLLAYGTMDRGAWETMTWGSLTAANIFVEFVEQGSFEAAAADVSLVIERHAPIPEPASLAILAFAALGLIAVRRHQR